MKESIAILFGVIVRGPDGGRYLHEPETGRFISLNKED